jgi:hypothetical protein
MNTIRIMSASRHIGENARRRGYLTSRSVTCSPATGAPVTRWRPCATIFSLPPSRVVSFWRERLGGSFDGRLFQRHPQSPTSGASFDLGCACPWDAYRLPWSKYTLDFPRSLSPRRCANDVRLSGNFTRPASPGNERGTHHNPDRGSFPHAISPMDRNGNRACVNGTQWNSSTSTTNIFLLRLAIPEPCLS